MRTSSGSSPIAETWKESTRSASRISPTAFGSGLASSSNIGVWWPTSRPSSSSQSASAMALTQISSSTRWNTTDSRSLRYVVSMTSGSRRPPMRREVSEKKPVDGSRPEETYIVTCLRSSNRRRIALRRLLSRSGRRASRWLSVRRFSVAVSVWVGRGGRSLSTSATHRATWSWSG